MESLTQIPQVEQGGPLFYFIMINLISLSTAEAIRTLINCITTLKIRDIQGEDVSTAISRIRGALRLSTNINAVPPDIQFILNAPTQHSHVTCWNCGEEGHVQAECPRPQNNSGHGGRSGGVGGRGGGRRRGQGHGRYGGHGRQFGGQGNNHGGRGFGHGGGRGQFQGRGGGMADPVKPVVDKLKTPPLKHGMMVRNIGGIQHLWCHHCHFWNQDQLTKDHAGTFNPAVQVQQCASFRDTIYHGTLT
jgi:Zinc knuckle